MSVKKKALSHRGSPTKMRLLVLATMSIIVAYAGTSIHSTSTAQVRHHRISMTLTCVLHTISIERNRILERVYNLISNVVKENAKVSRELGSDDGNVVRHFCDL